jgi:hypothetical protein
MKTILVVAALALPVAPASAKDLQFWNQTSHEFASVKLAPAGTGHWGAEQTANDPDGAVSADERLRITGVAAGKYDVRLAEKGGRVCIVHGVEVKATGKVAFAIGETQLSDCKP